ncbi:hypothetical protein TRFO_38498 [Tritrichomonas foetus]|uniref:Myb-like DNA-binding domain containing protein n=1 Tax=Tritrichomonas foetus TaxID=1144522 RepID=A0A1J4JCP7_9EUKA|nr:hypothetical protein TRFO_38498 [Tritrichomonas foetus]|eukprot:OHS95435.1 hypothetical protein TRFO_38498 [Tritrichomonas foetus]
MNIKRVRQIFTEAEDARLRSLVKRYGEKNWKRIAERMKDRNVRQCRERWLNALSDRVVKSNWTQEEDELLIAKFNEIGSKWKKMEAFFTGRVQYDLRNRYKTLTRIASAGNSIKSDCRLIDAGKSDITLNDGAGNRIGRELTETFHNERLNTSIERGSTSNGMSNRAYNNTFLNASGDQNAGGFLLPNDAAFHSNHQTAANFANPGNSLFIQKSATGHGQNANNSSHDEVNASPMKEKQNDLVEQLFGDPKMKSEGWNLNGDLFSLEEFWDISQFDFGIF